MAFIQQLEHRAIARIIISRPFCNEAIVKLETVFAKRIDIALILLPNWKRTWRPENISNPPMAEGQHIFGRSKTGMMIIKENLVRLNARQMTIQKDKRRSRLSKHGDNAIIFKCAQMDESRQCPFPELSLPSCVDHFHFA